jgi:hypothetical protein
MLSPINNKDQDQNSINRIGIMNPKNRPKKAIKWERISSENGGTNQNSLSAPVFTATSDKLYYVTLGGKKSDN